MADIREFIQNEIKSLAFKKVGFDDSLVKSKLLDSITFVELLVSIEDKTGKTFPQHMVNPENLDTINMICQVLETL
ncbi:MAG: hypothetical protein CVU05_12450 [Bacteroidetes bacterium HGW-Bacteroidetes-21]|jgi:acyl carrier protein|nr:MAG: hypothetical protein CVU05_12450 [Bacteroidetes bacterium HGW-Bacteroidetes-21]